MALYTFDSLPEFIAKVQELDARNMNHSGGGSWTNYTTYEQAIEGTLHGDSQYVSEAMKLIDELAVTMPATRAFNTIKSPYGGRCHMADWQVGSPTPMRRRIRSNTDYGPVKIVVSTTSSAAIDAETMKKRGATILALLLRLQEIRPIELYLLAELQGRGDGWHYQMIRVDTKPLDVSIAAFVLCNVAFARHLTYGLGMKLQDFNGAWPSGYYTEAYPKLRAERIGLNGDDIMIKEVHMNDPLVSKPITWLKEQLAKYESN